jgi:hypothetical protein
VDVRYWDHFPEDIEGKLSSRHRLAVAEVKDAFDFFISIEGTCVYACLGCRSVQVLTSPPLHHAQTTST